MVVESKHPRVLKDGQGIAARVAIFSLLHRIAGHHQLADRLVECQYELTDKLSCFVSGRKPVHNIGEHFLVPQVGRR